MKNHRLVMTEEDKSVEMAGFTAVIKSLKKNEESINSLKDYIDYPEVVVRKLEEIKSAILATNIALKKIEVNTAREFPKIPPYPIPEKFPKFPEFPKPLPFPNFPEMPKIDLTETNRLLKQLLDKKEDVKVTLKLK